jgi:hypothetical protein
MAKAWRVGRFPDEVWLTPRFGADVPAGADRISPGTAAWRAAAWLGGDDGTAKQALIEIHDATFGPGLTSPERSPLRLLDRVRAALGAGGIVAYRVRVALSGASVKAEVIEPKAPEPEKTWVEFIFEYPDGTPVKGLDYHLLHPGGTDEQGTLGDDGMISREDVAAGTYTVVLKEIEHVAWADKRVRAGEEARLVARIAGYPAGTEATIKIYREHRETDAEVIATLPGTIADGVIEVKFTYDNTTTDERKAEEGVAAFVAEVALDGGKCWAKTRAPLLVDLPTLSVPRWSSAYAEAGDEVEILADVTGIPEGTTVKLAIWEHAFDGDDRKVTDLPDGIVAGSKLAVACTYEEGEALPRAGEYFAVVSLDAGVKREARSALLWCSDMEG